MRPSGIVTVLVVHCAYTNVATMLSHTPTITFFIYFSLVDEHSHTIVVLFGFTTKNLSNEQSKNTKPMQEQHKGKCSKHPHKQHAH